jgi:hypothetical protein
MGLFKSIGKAIGKIGKGILGAGIGFISSGGNPLGAVLGGIGGLFGGGGGGGDAGGRVGVYIPPTVQEAFNIAKGLEGQIGNIASSQYNIQKPYFDEALSIFRNFPNTVNQLFSDTENRVAHMQAYLIIYKIK